MEHSRLKILFLCTGNSCRSQMAEGLTRSMKGGDIEAFSAGTDPHGIDPRAIEVMNEIGIDISGQKSKHVESLAGISFDYVITVCGNADRNCPAFPGPVKVIHVGFDDPPALVRAARDDEEALSHYRRVRDEIRAFVATLPGSLERYDARFVVI